METITIIRRWRLMGLYFLLSVFSTWAAYRMHVVPIEADAFALYHSLVDFNGRAPDQYRVLPYLLIEGIRQLFSTLPGLDLTPRYPVLLFNVLFLTLSTWMLHRLFGHLSAFAWLVLLFHLIYPMSMFDGYRPVTPLLLYLTTAIVFLMVKGRRNQAVTTAMAAALITLLAFSRADLALLMALFCVRDLVTGLAGRLVLVSIPLAVQWMLSEVIFPDARYEATFVMLFDNLSLQFMAIAPLTYLFAGLLLYHWRTIADFLRYTWRHQRWFLLIFLAYTVTLVIVARPNEYRLFLPLVPVLLYLLHERGQGEAAAVRPQH